MNKQERRLTKQFRNNRNRIKKTLDRLNNVTAELQWEIAHSDEKSYEDAQGNVQDLIRKQRKAQMKLFRYSPSAATTVIAGTVPS